MSNPEVSAPALRELAEVMAELPSVVDQIVRVTITTPGNGHVVGSRVLELAEMFPQHGPELRRIALQVGFDPFHKVRRLPGVSAAQVA
jgi:hypothetical protein